VAIARLDLFCRREGIESIDFLEVDAEGHELAVLEGAGAMLDGVQIAALQFEFGGTALDARVYLRDFFDLLSPRYTLHRLLSDGLWPIAEYGEQHEVFAYANYVGLSRSTRFASSSER
jgi:Methyltransferase FkbM domain